MQQRVARIKQSVSGLSWVEFTGHGSRSVWDLTSDVLKMARANGFAVVDERKATEEG